MRRRLSPMLLALAAPALLADAALPPSELYGPLFGAVQLAHVFADGKTFADAVPKRAPSAIRADYDRQNPSGTAALHAFVLANFTLPAGPAPPAAAPKQLPLAEHIASLWPMLTRAPQTPPEGSSALALPSPYVVPGGRFREIYYWDSYFTMLGLAADGRQDLIESMLGDFESLITRYGHIPNGTRSYYLSRSQPPFFALMAGLSTVTDRATRQRRLAALRREHAFWMAGEHCGEPACARIVHLPGGGLLNRYYDDRATPRDESYAEDVATAAATPRSAAGTWRNVRAAAESGWDFSSRWLDDPQQLASIRTTAIVPVDLNSLLYALEIRIAAGCATVDDAGCAREFAARSRARAKAIHRWLWRPAEARFADYDWQRRRSTPVLSAATLYPLFAGVATPAEAAAVAKTIEVKLLAPGGLQTTDIVTGQQWDRPNGWAPLQWIAVAGLDRYGATALAQTIACRFLATVMRTYDATGKLLEKYDVETQRAGGGGEYPTQDGFGWTNGVVRALQQHQSHGCPSQTP